MQEHEAGGGEATSPVDAPDPMRLWNRGVDGLAALGTIMIVFLMAIIAADVIARNVMGASLPLIAELGALTVVLIVFLQLGAAVRSDRLVSADFLLDALSTRSPMAAAIIRAVWDLFGFAVCLGIAWASWGILRNDWNHQEFIGVTGVMTLPTSPFRALIFLGAAVAAAQFLLLAARRLRQARNRGASL